MYRTALIILIGSGLAASVYEGRADSWGKQADDAIKGVQVPAYSPDSNYTAPKVDRVEPHNTVPADPFGSAANAAKYNPPPNNPVSQPSGAPPPKFELNSNLKDITSLSPSGQPATTTSPASGNANSKSTAAPAPVASHTFSETATSSKLKLGSYGVSQQEVVKVRAATSSVLLTPTSTNVWSAAGKPINFVNPPASVAPSNWARKPQPDYGVQSDASSEFAQQLGIAILTGVLQGAIASRGGGGGFQSVGGGKRIGGACDHWTSNIATCRAVR
jgi:hypothetical protein